MTHAAITILAMLAALGGCTTYAPKSPDARPGDAGVDPQPEPEPEPEGPFLCCGCSFEEDMGSRIRGPFVAGTKPTYDDPDDVLTEAEGFFQKDVASNPPTQLSADWCNMIQEEPRNLIAALGLTPRSDLDNQLATALQEGRFARIPERLQVRKQFYPHEPDQVGTTETPVASGMSGIEDVVETQVETRGAGVTAVDGYLPPYPSFILLLLGAAVSNGCRIYTGHAGQAGNGIIADLDNVSFTAQWEANIGSVGGTAVGANGADIYMGLHSDPDAIGDSSFDDDTANSFAMFRKLSGDTNWQCRVGDTAAGSTVDTGVAPVEDTPQIFRLEYYGANTALGIENGSATARFFIDGNQVAEIADGNVPTGATALGLSFQIYATATGPDQNLGLVLSPITAEWTVL